MAIEKATQLCASNSLMLGQDIVIVSDSKVTVSLINDKGFGSLKHLYMVYDIRSYLETFSGTVVSFNSRASNSFVDNLAKLGSNMARDFI
ncbi:hypothetical protein LWI29_006581 [Acer saccharum]|uniref:RNase H type-1 domain-containing protein n=1 Tax=Acer saccharum TaxID=4024 RepID=A0AA39RXG9_ACESA|nr:hypothetical protein LWI29_006581 [Acer saccharum]